MRNIFPILIFLLTTATGFSQSFSHQLVGSGGGQTDNAAWSCSWSVGEPVAGASSAGNFKLTEGFQQGFPPFDAGAISTTGQTICYSGNPSLIDSLTSASGGDNVFRYQWQKSTTDSVSGFADIASATGTTYDPPDGLTTTTWYRRMAKDGTCNTTFSASEGVWKVTVRDNFATGAIDTTGATICYNGDPGLIGSMTDASGGDNIIGYLWQSRPAITDGPPTWTDITGATNATFDPPSGLTSSTDYRRKAKDGTCNTTFTASAGVWTVTVRPELASGAIATTGETICSGSSPATTVGNVTPGSGGANRIAYSWRSSADSYATAIAGATSSTYLPGGPLTETTSYKRYVMDSTCKLTPEVSTGTWTVTVNPPTDAGAVTGGTGVCYGANSTLLTLSGHTGTVTKWQYSTDQSNWVDLTGQTSTTYTAEDLTEDTWFRAVVQSGNCADAFSDASEITILTSFKLSGYAKYENNPKTALNGMKITLRKDGTILGSPVVTSPTGYYEFTDLEQGNYSLDIASSHPSGQWQTWGGVNNTDYLLVSKHIAGTQLLPVSPPVVRTAASVKLPHPAINTADATAIRQAAKFPTTGYTYFDTAKWVFSGVDAAHALNNITVGCADVTLDIRGLCSGDVNGTYVPPAGYKMAEPGLTLENHGVLPITDDIRFPIRVNRDMEIGAITLYLNYDPSLIDITGVEIPGQDEQPWFSANDGVLYVGWISTEPVTMRDNETILLIHARITNHQSPITDNQSLIKSNPMIRFTLNDSPLSELSDANGNVSGGLILSIPDAGTNGETVKWQNGKILCYPNPARETLNIELETFNLKPETLNLEILNLQGVAVIEKTAITPENSWYKDQLDLRELAPGVYFLRANVGGEIIMKKVVISR